MLQKFLKQLGIDEKQAKVYLAALILGSAPAGLIAEKSEIPRTTCYRLLEKLRSKGLISRFTKKSTRCYTVEDPRKVIKLAEEKIQTLQKTLPKLENLFFSKNAQSSA